MKQLRILIIDDNQDLTDGLGVVLEGENHLVSLAYSGNDGIKLFDAGQFDVVFIDVRLPDISGVEVFMDIHKKNQDTKIIMISGYRVEQILREVIDEGDVEILRKPFEIMRVLEILRQIRNEGIVLISNDTPGYSEGLSSFLNEQGMKTMHATNFQKAIEGVLSNQIDVLVLNLRMPIMCGIRIYQELKQRGCTVKTIIVTSLDEEMAESSDVFKSVTATGCLFKPFNPVEMLDVLENVMSN